MAPASATDRRRRIVQHLRTRCRSRARPRAATTPPSRRAFPTANRWEKPPPEWAGCRDSRARNLLARQSPLFLSDTPQPFRLVDDFDPMLLSLLELGAGPRP